MTRAEGEEINQINEKIDNFIKKYCDLDLEFVNKDKIYNKCKNIYNTKIKELMNDENNIREIMDILEKDLSFLNLEFDSQSSIPLIKLSWNFCHIFNEKRFFDHTQYDYRNW